MNNGIEHLTGEIDRLRDELRTSQREIANLKRKTGSGRYLANAAIAVALAGLVGTAYGAMADIRLPQRPLTQPPAANAGPAPVQPAANPPPVEPVVNGAPATEAPGKDAGGPTVATDTSTSQNKDGVFVAPFIVKSASGATLLSVSDDGGTAVVSIAGTLLVVKESGTVEITGVGGAGNIKVSGKSDIVTIGAGSSGGGSVKVQSSGGNADAELSSLAGGGSLQLFQAGKKMVDVTEDRGAGQVSVMSGGDPLASLQASGYLGGEVDVYGPNKVLAGALSGQTTGGSLAVITPGGSSKDAATLVAVNAFSDDLGIKIKKGGKRALTLEALGTSGLISVLNGNETPIATMGQSPNNGGEFDVYASGGVKPIVKLHDMNGAGEIEVGDEAETNSVKLDASEKELGLYVEDHNSLEVFAGDDNGEGAVQVTAPGGKVASALQISKAGGGEVDVYSSQGTLVGDLGSRPGGGLLKVQLDADTDTTSAAVSASNEGLGFRLRKEGEVRSEIVVNQDGAATVNVGATTGKPLAELVGNATGGLVRIYDKAGSSPTAYLKNSDDGSGGVIRAQTTTSADNYVAVGATGTSTGMKVRTNNQTKIFAGADNNIAEVYVYGTTETPAAGIETYGAGKGELAVFNSAGEPVSFLSESKDGEGGEMTVADPSGNGVFAAGYSASEDAEVCLDNKHKLWCMGKNLPLQMN